MLQHTSDLIIDYATLLSLSLGLQLFSDRIQFLPYYYLHIPYWRKSGLFDAHCQTAQNSNLIISKSPNSKRILSDLDYVSAFYQTSPPQ